LTDAADASAAKTMAVLFMTVPPSCGFPSHFLRPASNLADFHDYHKKSRPVVTDSVPFSPVCRPRGKDVLVGCIDVASNVVETPQG
jgi:hypothetical protein